MKNQLPVVASVKGLGQIVEVVSDFYTELLLLKNSEARLITPRDEALARLETRTKEKIGMVTGTRTTSGFEYVKSQPPILKFYSRLNDPKLAKATVNANKKREYYHTKTTKEYEESFEEAEQDRNKDPKERNSIVLPSRDAFTISDKENWDVYEVMLKDQAKPYFEYNGPITVYPIEKATVDAQNGTILNVLWFRGFEGGSIFYGFSRNINHNDQARGIFANNLEYTKNRVTTSLYPQKQIDEYIKLVEGVRSGHAPVSKLTLVAKFLKNIKSENRLI